ncbi:MAG: septum formation initiator family protein [Nitrospirota bacterium]|nr:septum formation initiator family protein [Nitrospirota bacterium]
MRPNNKKHLSRGFWGDLFNRLPFVGAFLIMSVLAGTIFFNEDGLPLYFQMRENRQHVVEQIQQLEYINVSMQEDIIRIQSDPQRLEELARNRLGMVRPGEKVYQFVEPAPSSIMARW